MNECKKCGECCKQLIFFIPSLPPEHVEYYEKKGCVIEGTRLLIPYVCPHLTEDNLCAIHEDKPILCKEYEGQSGYYIPKGCSYDRSKKETS